MTVAQIAAIIEEIAPRETAEPWDNVGLQVGDARAEVSRVLVTLDVTGAVVAEAVEVSAELIVAHHPLIFDPLRAVVAGDVVAELVKRLLDAGVALYAAHTNLDAAAEIGTTAALSNVLGLEDLAALVERPGPAAGGVGRLPRPVSLSDFAGRIRTSLDCSRLTVVGDADRQVAVVAVMPGAGGDAVRSAVAAGADVLVCGDLKHHDALYASEAGLAVVDAGHYATERPVVDSLADYLINRCAGDVDVVKSRIVTDPFAAQS